MALLQVKHDHARKIKKMKDPSNVREVRQLFEETSFNGIQTMIIGALVSFSVGFILWLIVGFITNDFSIVKLLVWEIASFIFIGAMGLKNVPQTSHAIITIFGKRSFRDSFENGDLSILEEGWNWLPPLICGATIIDTRERSVKIPENKIVVPDPANKKNGITVIFKGAQINFRVKNLFALLDTGEADVDSEILAIAGEEIRDFAAKTAEANAGEGPERIFEANVNLKVLAALQKEGNNDRWGILPISVATPGIEFASADSEKAYEARYKEEREQEAESIQRETLSQMSTKLMEDFGISGKEALEISQRISKVLRPSDIFVTSSGGANSLSEAAAILAAGLQQQNGNNNPDKPKGGK